MPNSRNTRTPRGCSHSPASRLAELGLASSNATRAPALACASAATQPAGPAPTTATSNEPSLPVIRLSASSALVPTQPPRTSPWSACFRFAFAIARSRIRFLRRLILPVNSPVERGSAPILDLYLNIGQRKVLSRYRDLDRTMQECAARRMPARIFKCGRRGSLRETMCEFINGRI